MGCFGGGGSRDAEEDKKRKEANKKIEKQIQKDKQIYRATHRLLLLGELYYLIKVAHLSMLTFKIKISSMFLARRSFFIHFISLFYPLGDLISIQPNTHGSMGASSSHLCLQVLVNPGKAR